MKKWLRSYVILIGSILCVCFCKAQQQPFYEEIQAFKHADSIQPPPPRQILFVGSSSFRFWTDVQNYFPSFPILNRGFGGSALPDVIRYANDIIFPYHPKEIVIYCGENDLAASDEVTADTVINRFKYLFGLIRNKLPRVPIVFISIKPSPSRAHLMNKMVAANSGIKSFLLKQKRAAYVDVYSKMLDTDGKPIKELFKEDSLHMNEKGYAIWQKQLKPFLIK